jgi:hypothetical protein
VIESIAAHIGKEGVGRVPHRVLPDFGNVLYVFSLSV